MTLSEGIKKGFREEVAVGWCVNNGYDLPCERGRKNTRAWRQKRTRLTKDHPASRMLGYG